MREIKFRAWENGRMRYDFWQRCDLGNYLNSVGVFKEVQIMQYTGMKDRTGRDIYEGDIIEVFIESPVSDQDLSTTYRSVVKWDSETGGFDLDNDYHSYKVIGNIYENPELIKS